MPSPSPSPAPHHDPRAFLEANPVDPSLLPTEADVRSYEENGWFVAPPLIAEALLDETSIAAERHQRGDRDWALPIDSGYSDWKPGDPEPVRNNEFASLQSAGLRRLALQPILGAVAARLARCEVIRLFDDQLVWKPTQAPDSAVGWHSDRGYWSTCTSPRMLTAWIPLHDSDEERGTLMAVSGSHRWPESEHLRGFNDPDLHALEAKLGRRVPPESIASFRLEKGQVSFHHASTLHGSHPNTSDEPRFALAVHMQDGENAYRAFHTPEGRRIQIPHDGLCRRQPNGDPDYGDPQAFPTIWSAQGS